jgi:hypothetical protein
MERKEASFKLHVQEAGSICFNGKEIFAGMKNEKSIIF